MPNPQPTLVRCQCGQVIARVTGKTVRVLTGELAWRDNRAIITCPACGERHRLGAGIVERDAA